MANNKDFIEILREIRGSATPGQPSTDGIWYELTEADKNGNPGVYGDILAKYGIINDSTSTLNQAVAIIDGLTVIANSLPAGSAPTATLQGTTLTLGLPSGVNGADGAQGPVGPIGPIGNTGPTGPTGPKGDAGVDGHTPTQAEIDTVVSTNVNVQAANNLLDTTITEATATINNSTNSAITAYDTNAADRLQEYDLNHTNKLDEYNTNNDTKIAEYNANHIDRLNDINYAYADRIMDMIKTRNFMGIMDEYVAQTETNMITFLSTNDTHYIYYGNGVLLKEGTDYTVYDTKTIELAVKTNPYDTIIQVNTKVLNDMLTAEGMLFENRIGQPNGVAGLDNNALIPSAQLPSYVDDVLEVATYADLPATGETGKIYVVVKDENNGNDTSSYRWSGSVYAIVSNTLTEADIKALYEANANTNEFTDAEKAKVGYVTVTQAVDLDAMETKQGTAILGTTATDLSAAVNEVNGNVNNHTTDTSNPHSVTKTQVGLSNVDNTTDMNKPISTAQQSALDLKQNVIAEGAFVDGDKTKLDGIEAGATADQTGTEIKTLYEVQANTNAYTDSEKVTNNKIDNSLVTSVVFNADGTITIVTL